jgi:hypothetical protein
MGWCRHSTAGFRPLSLKYEYGSGPLTVKVAVVKLGIGVRNWTINGETIHRMTKLSFRQDLLHLACPSKEHGSAQFSVLLQPVPVLPILNRPTCTGLCSIHTFFLERIKGNNTIHSESQDVGSLSSLGKIKD